MPAQTEADNIVSPIHNTHVRFIVFNLLAVYSLQYVPAVGALRVRSTPPRPVPHTVFAAQSATAASAPVAKAGKPARLPGASRGPDLVHGLSVPHLTRNPTRSESRLSSEKEACLSPDNYSLGIPLGLSAGIWLTIPFGVTGPRSTRLQELIRMSKSKDTRKEKKKAPQMTLKEKRQAKREKKNA